MSTKYVGEADLIYYSSALKAKTDAKYVAKESGKGLSTNDYTTAEKNKLKDIAEGAEVNVQADWNETNTASDAYIKNKPNIPSGVVVDAAMSDTSENAIQNKVVKKYIDDKTSAIYRPKGSIAFANLPTTGMSVGDVYNITDAFTTTAAFEEGAGKSYPAGTNVVYDSNNKWDVLSGIVDLSGYLKKTDLVELTTTEIDTIVNNAWG